MHSYCSTCINILVIFFFLLSLVANRFSLSSLCFFFLPLLRQPITTTIIITTRSVNHSRSNQPKIRNPPNSKPIDQTTRNQWVDRRRFDQASCSNGLILISGLIGGNGLILIKWEKRRVRGSDWRRFDQAACGLMLINGSGVMLIGGERLVAIDNRGS